MTNDSLRLKYLSLMLHFLKKIWLLVRINELSLRRQTYNRKWNKKVLFAQCVMSFEIKMKNPFLIQKKLKVMLCHLTFEGKISLPDNGEEQMQHSCVRWCSQMWWSAKLSQNAMLLMQPYISTINDYRQMKGKNLLKM